MKAWKNAIPKQFENKQTYKTNKQPTKHTQQKPQANLSLE
jgi:hypothetical protein